MPLPVMTVETVTMPERLIRPPAEHVPRRSWPSGAGPVHLPVGMIPDKPVTARVNHGRWIGDCPVCHVGAQLLSRTDHRMCCAECFCGWFPVVWPADVDDIEALLERRLNPATRNWSPGETVTDLSAENACHGVGSELH